MANQKVLSPKSLEVLQSLKGIDKAITMADLGIENLNSAHLTALVNRGLVVAEKVIVEVPTVVKRKVNAYSLTEKGQAFKALT
jgi:hypothetical protein